MKRAARVLKILLILAFVFAQCGVAFAETTEPGPLGPTATELELGAIWTTDTNGNRVNQNHYGTIHDVYLNGGPEGNARFTPGGTYYVRVTTPNGTQMGSTFTVVANANGVIGAHLCLIGAEPPAGEYKVWVSRNTSFAGCDSRTDNFSLDPVTATLTVNKIITGDSGYDPGLSFTVTIGRACGHPIIRTVSVSTPLVLTLAVGTYGITETLPADPYSYVSGNGRVNLTANGATVTLTNNYSVQRGTLTIRKAITGDTGSDPNQAFSVTVTPPTGPVMTGTVSVNTPWVIPALVVGTYAVAETGTVPNYTYVSGNGNVDLTVSGNSVTLTNSYTAPRGTLTIYKTLEGDFGANVDQMFSVNVTTPTGGTLTGEVSVLHPLVFPNLPLGTYVVTETGSAPNYTYVSGNGGVEVTTTGGSTTLRNQFRLPRATLTITKSIIGEAGFNPNQLFTVAVTPPGASQPFTVEVSVNRPVQLTNLPIGTYRIAETGSVPDYTYVSGNNDYTLTTVGATVTMINSYKTPPPPTATLTVTKMIESRDGDPTLMFPVEVLNGNDQVVASGGTSVNDPAEFTLPLGTYTVREITSGLPAKYEFVRVIYPAIVVPTIEPTEPTNVRLGPDGAEVTVVNRYVPSGTLTIRKSIIGDLGWSPIAEFPITVTESGLRLASIGTMQVSPRVGSITASREWTLNLPPGYYMVTEGAMPSTRYTPERMDVDPRQILRGEGEIGIPAPLGTEVLVTDGGTVIVTVVNRYTEPYTPPENDPPEAVDDSATTPMNTPVAIPVLPNDSDPDGDPLTIVANTAPSHGTVVQVGNEFSYTPATDYTGTDLFTYTISDGHGHTDTANVTITITPPDNPPPPPPPPPPVLPDTGGSDPLAFAVIGLALSVVGYVLRRKLA